MDIDHSKHDLNYDPLKTDNGEKQNQCNQCEYACSDPGALWAHLRTHT